MSKGMPGDDSNTKQEKTRRSASGGKNWLRHGKTTEAAAIDELLLTGRYTIEEMAREISPLSEKSPPRGRGSRKRMKMAAGTSTVEVPRRVEVVLSSVSFRTRRAV